MITFWCRYVKIWWVLEFPRWHLTRLGWKFWLLAGHLLSSGGYFVYVLLLHVKILECVFTLLYSMLNSPLVFRGWPKSSQTPLVPNVCCSVFTVPMTSVHASLIINAEGWFCILLFLLLMSADLVVTFKRVWNIVLWPFSTSSWLEK